MSDEQIKQMVNRFLGWKLPEDFMPDAGISYKKPENPMWWPIGTNLLTATQAEQMIRYITEQPTKEQSAQGLGEVCVWPDCEVLVMYAGDFCRKHMEMHLQAIELTIKDNGSVAVETGEAQSVRAKEQPDGKLAQSATLDTVEDILLGIAEECGVINHDVTEAKQQVERLLLSRAITTLEEVEFYFGGTEVGKVIEAYSADRIAELIKQREQL